MEYTSSAEKDGNNNRIIIEQWVINVRAYAIWCVEKGFSIWIRIRQ